MAVHEKIDYVEFPAASLDKTQQFFAEVFGWQFEAFGDDYLAFKNAGLEGGFFRSTLQSRCEQGAALVVFYSEALEQTQDKVLAAGGSICRPIFTFPGGRRFHFIEPSGNELAVWSDQ